MADLSKQEFSIDWVLYWLREKSDSIGKKIVVVQDLLNPILPSLRLTIVSSGDGSYCLLPSKTSFTSYVKCHNDETWKVKMTSKDFSNRITMSLLTPAKIWKISLSYKMIITFKFKNAIFILFSSNKRSKVLTDHIFQDFGILF